MATENNMSIALPVKRVSRLTAATTRFAHSGCSVVNTESASTVVAPGDNIALRLLHAISPHRVVSMSFKCSSPPSTTWASLQLQVEPSKDKIQFCHLCERVSGIGSWSECASPCLFGECSFLFCSCPSQSTKSTSSISQFRLACPCDSILGFSYSVCLMAVPIHSFIYVIQA